MNKITYFAPVCNNWLNKNFENIGEEVGQCPSCASLNTLEYKKSCVVWRWHIRIPGDWVYGNWSQVNLYLEQVHLPVLRCSVCKELIKVSPSFLLQGTTLTLPALAFIIFAYETSDLTWRDLPEKFDDGKEKIAHSTLYIAAHRMGKLLENDSFMEDLRRRYLPSYKSRRKTSVTLIEGKEWALPKSLFTHTQAREKGARRLVADLLPGKTKNLKFQHFFFHHLNNLNHTFAGWNKPLPKLYSRNPAEKRMAA